MFIDKSDYFFKYLRIPKSFLLFCVTCLTCVSYIFILFFRYTLKLFFMCNLMFFCPLFMISC